MLSEEERHDDDANDQDHHESAADADSANKEAESADEGTGFHDVADDE